MKKSFAKRALEQKTITYLYYVRCEQQHLENYSVSLGRYYIYRQNVYRWRDCLYFGRGCYYYYGQGHFKKDCPMRAEYVQGQRQQTQSYQQLVTVDRHIRPLHLRTSGNHSRSQGQGERT